AVQTDNIARLEEQRVKLQQQLEELEDYQDKQSQKIGEIRRKFSNHMQSQAARFLAEATTTTTFIEVQQIFSTLVSLQNNSTLQQENQCLDPKLCIFTQFGELLKSIGPSSLSGEYAVLWSALFFTHSEDIQRIFAQFPITL